MKTTNLLFGLALLFAAIFSAAAQTVSTTPTNNPTFKGRVLDDDTGQPVAGVRIIYGFVHKCDGECAGDRAYVTRTDAEGRYEGVFEPLGSAADGHYAIRIEPTNYVRQVFNVDKADIGKMETIPDTRLRRGGWISGRAERPGEFTTNALAFINLTNESLLPEHTQPLHVNPDRDGRFRTPLLPPGSYTLSGIWESHISSDRVRGIDFWKVVLLNSVSNVNVTVGQEAANINLTTNGIVRTNRAYWR